MNFKLNPYLKSQWLVDSKSHSSLNSNLKKCFFLVKYCARGGNCLKVEI